MIQDILFYFFSFNTLASALMVIASLNPIHSVLFLVFVFFNGAGLLLLLEVEFLAMAFLVVYVGAIAVLFLFVVMLLNIRLIEFNESLYRYAPIGIILGLAFLLEIYVLIETTLSSNAPLITSDTVTWVNEIYRSTNIELIGQILYTHYFPLFLISGMVLLLAMVGAIVLTLRHSSSVKRQEIFAQLAQKPSSVKTHTFIVK